MKTFCGQCGTENLATDKFCRNCGKPLAGTSPAVDPAPAAAIPMPPQPAPYAAMGDRSVPSSSGSKRLTVGIAALVALFAMAGGGVYMYQQDQQRQAAEAQRVRAEAEAARKRAEEAEQARVQAERAKAEAEARASQLAAEQESAKRQADKAKADSRAAQDMAQRESLARQQAEREAAQARQAALAGALRNNVQLTPEGICEARSSPYSRDRCYAYECSKPEYYNARICRLIRARTR